MSGGSWDYFYGRLGDVASRLQCERDPLRKAFGLHLQKCAKALHDIEWVDSQDCSPGDAGGAVGGAPLLQQRYRRDEQWSFSTADVDQAVGLILLRHIDDLTRAMGQMEGRHQHGGDVGSTPSCSPNKVI